MMKFLLAVALGLLLGTVHGQTPGVLERPELRSSPATATSVPCVGPGGSTTVPGEVKEYTFLHDGQPQSYGRYLLVADPAVGPAYIGMVPGVLVRLTRGLVGISELSSNGLVYDLGARLPITVSPAAKAADRWQAFDDSKLIYTPEAQILTLWMPRAIGRTLQGGAANLIIYRIGKTAVAGDTLTINFGNPRREHTASLVIDASADRWKVKEAALDGRKLDGPFE